jgi:Photosynthesis system II assembly factor YCF48/Putative zinc-finger
VIPGPCLDAETIAAWADDSLTAGERAAAEAHAADCARCQAVVAAMVRAEPPAEPAPAWWRRGSTLGWLVPLTAAAAALIWVVSPGTIRRPQDAAPAQAIAEAPPPSPSLEMTPQRTPQATIDNGNLVARSDKTVDALSAMKPPAREQDAPVLKSAAAPPAAPAAVAPAPEPARPALSADRMAASGALREQAFANSLRAEPMPEIVSSNPASRWRITPTPGLLQHSADGGSTWERQQTNVAAELTAGASPMPSVCWLVGRGGVVLLSTDARTWRRVSFPESADLTAVRATDASTATVTTADGRKFSTSDGGVTWDRDPPQEFSATPF